MRMRQEQKSATRVLQVVSAMRVLTGALRLVWRGAMRVLQAVSAICVLTGAMRRQSA